MTRTLGARRAKRDPVGSYKEALPKISRGVPANGTWKLAELDEYGNELR